MLLYRQSEMLQYESRANPVTLTMIEGWIPSEINKPPFVAR